VLQTLWHNDNVHPRADDPTAVKAISSVILQARCLPAVKPTSGKDYAPKIITIITENTHNT